MFNQFYNDISGKLQQIKIEINSIVKVEQTAKKVLQKLH